MGSMGSYANQTSMPPSGGTASDMGGGAMAGAAGGAMQPVNDFLTWLQMLSSYNPGSGNNYAASAAPAPTSGSYANAAPSGNPMVAPPTGGTFADAIRGGNIADVASPATNMASGESAPYFNDFTPPGGAMNVPSQKLMSDIPQGNMFAGSLGDIASAKPDMSLWRTLLERFLRNRRPSGPWSEDMPPMVRTSNPGAPPYLKF